jgi:hypothetical protein
MPYFLKELMEQRAALGQLLGNFWVIILLNLTFSKIDWFSTCFGSLCDSFFFNLPTVGITTNGWTVFFSIRYDRGFAQRSSCDFPSEEES